MKTLFFSKTYTVHDRRFLLKFAESGHQTCFLRLQREKGKLEPPPANIVMPEPLCEEEVSTPEDCLKLMPALEKAVAEFKPDVVHAGPVQTCGFMAALLEFHPFVVMSWGSDILVDAFSSERMRWVSAFALKNCDYFIGDCAEVVKKAGELAGAVDGRATVFPWGVDLKVFRPPENKKDCPLRKKLGWRKETIVISTRSWEDIYGVETLLKAFRIATLGNPDLRMIMLGGGSQASMIDEYIAKYEMERLVNRPGVIENHLLAEYFQCADIYLSCSLTDGSSISLLEAMACGLPVVVSKIPGNLEWVADGMNGFLGETGSGESFATGLKRLLAMPEKSRAEIGSRNLALARERADWDKNFDKLMALYKNIEAKAGKS